MAVSNIVRNEVEDRVYGEVFKRLPRQIGAAVNPAQAYNRARAFDGDRSNDQAMNPLNDLVQRLVNGVSERLGLEPPRKC